MSGKSARTEGKPEIMKIKEEKFKEMKFLPNDLDAIFSSKKDVRNMILDYVIQEGDAVSVSNIANCRLVNKLWLKSISEYLVKSGKPALQVFLDKTNSISGSSYVRRNGRKALERFVDIFTTSAFQPIPPFKIKTTADFFHQENYQSLLDCFSRCGGSLIQLEIEFPKDGGSLGFVFPHINLPILRSLTVTFLDVKLKATGKEEIMMGSVIYPSFIQLLMSGCKDLREVMVKEFSAKLIPDKLIPVGFEYLVFPKSVRSLNICQLQTTGKHLEQLLVGSSFPHLKKLYLCIPIIQNIPFSKDGIIYKILKTVRRTLTHLYIEGVYYAGVPKATTNFFLPLMEKLHTFDSNSAQLELHSEVRMLEHSVPKLNTLSLHNQTVTMFQKWMDNSKYTSVKELVVSLVDEKFVQNLTKYYLNFGSEIMHQIDVACPNIQTLEITVSGTELSGLKYIFQNMKQLQTLRIDVIRSDDVVNSNIWDSLLIGISIDVLVVLKSLRRDLWNELAAANDLLPTIRNLTELQELEIRPYAASTEPLLANSLISDATFHFAFLKMTKLMKLSLRHRFMVSPEMKLEWESAGRKINYVPERYGP